LYYITPEDFPNGKVDEILKRRQKKLYDALDNRKNYWKNTKSIA